MNDHESRVLRLRGTPFEIGQTAGRRMGARLAANIDEYVRERVPPGTRFEPEAWEAAALPWLRALPDRFQQELEGLAAGSGVPLQRLAEWACIEEHVPAQCSAFVCVAGGHTWVGRNNDTFAPRLWGHATIREIPGRIPWISFGMEGDVFTPTGVNRERLWLHYHYLPVEDAPPAGPVRMPAYAFLVEALETCRSLPELEELLAAVPRDQGMLLFAADGKSRDFAVFECGCTALRRRDSRGTWIVGTNHCCIGPRPWPEDDGGPLSSSSRQARLEALVAVLDTGTPAVRLVETMIRILADEAIERRVGMLVTAASNVACPGTGEIWYTFGGFPAASRGNWRRLDWPW
jgi:hypothetical protein